MTGEDRDQSREAARRALAVEMCGLHRHAPAPPPAYCGTCERLLSLLAAHEEQLAEQVRQLCVDTAAEHYEPLLRHEYQRAEAAEAGKREAEERARILNAALSEEQANVRQEYLRAQTLEAEVAHLRGERDEAHEAIKVWRQEAILNQRRVEVLEKALRRLDDCLRPFVNSPDAEVARYVSLPEGQSLYSFATDLLEISEAALQGTEPQPEPKA